MKYFSKQKWILCVLLLALLLALTGCGDNSSDPSNEQMPPDNTDGFIAISPGGSVPTGDYVVVGPGGVIISGSEDPESTTEAIPTETEEPLVTLPDGTEVHESQISYLEDGTMVVRHRPFGSPCDHHKCFLPDGSMVKTHYSNSNGTTCEYEEAASIWADWYTADGQIWKELLYRAEDMVILQGKVYEYTTIAQSEGDLVYHSATNHYTYDNDVSFIGSRDEFDPYHGSEKPIYRCSYDLDGNITDYYTFEYHSLTGILKQEEQYLEDGTLQARQKYDENGVLSYDLRCYHDGKYRYETFYTDGVITLENYRAEDGRYFVSTTYKNGIKYFSSSTNLDSWNSDTTYDEQGRAKECIYRDHDGNRTGYVVFEHYEDGGSKSTTTYSDGRTQTEEYFHTNGEFSGYLLCHYYANGQLKSLEEYDSNYNLIRSEKYDEDGTPID